MQSFRIMLAPGLNEVSLCRCEPFGFCVFLPPEIPAGQGRDDATALLTPEEEAFATAAFRSGQSMARSVPDGCARLVAALTVG